MAHHWGELPAAVAPDTDSGMATLEWEQITKPRQLDIKGPDLYQRETEDKQSTQRALASEQFPIDSLTRHTIKLLQYSKKLKQHIESVQNQKKRLVEGDDDLEFAIAPPVPECDGCNLKHTIKTAIPFLPKETSREFTLGIAKAQPVLDAKSTRMLLKRAVMAICSHAGYDSCSESVLDTLTDITGEQLLKITRLLRTAVDNEALRGSTGFQNNCAPRRRLYHRLDYRPTEIDATIQHCFNFNKAVPIVAKYLQTRYFLISLKRVTLSVNDVMEQVFHEIGIGSTTELHGFYTRRVINYHNNMIALCWQLYKDYERLRTEPMETLTSMKSETQVKEEPISGDEDLSKVDTDTLKIEEEFNTYKDSPDHNDEAFNEEEFKWPKNSFDSTDRKPSLLDLDFDDSHSDEQEDFDVFDPLSPQRKKRKR